MEEEPLRLPRDMRLILHEMARDEDITPGQLVRRLISKEISRRLNARPPDRADEQLVAPLRARLAPDLSEAPTWQDLHVRLRDKGFELREAGGGLALHAFPDGRRICKASDLGFGYSRLMRRIGAPFPGHRHRSLTDRVLPTPEQDPEMDDHVFEVMKTP
ncbi:hypothetical protein [Marinibacterium profundimaris]|uniref:hypothetical protein n=1 Tax=Marinibacterium profundimaris TaxID=1679460 RepID=UPI001E3EB21E|nr:hypothetical protein [Marinibacterium profundimaris]